MRIVYGSTVLVCLLCSSTVHAGDREEIPLDSPALIEALQTNLRGAEVLQAFREVENGEECYSVKVRSGGRVCEYYISPDGRSSIFKNQVFSLEMMLEALVVCLIISLFPCAVAGAIARRICQVCSARRMSIFLECLSALVGGLIALGIVFLLTKHARYRHRDVPIEVSEYFLFGVISASFVEALGLMSQSRRGYRTGCRRWIFHFCSLAIISMLLHSARKHARIGTRKPI